MTCETKPTAAAVPPTERSRQTGSVCPNCGAPRVHRSHRKGLTERLLATVGAQIRRCHACDVRFARLFTSAVYISDVNRAARRGALVLLMAAGTILVLAAMLWFMHKDAVIGSSDCSLAPRTSSPALPPRILPS